MTARSTATGSSSTDGQQGIAATERAFGLTGYSGPWNPDSIRLRTISCPIPPGCRPAPTTAIELGSRSRAIERTTASRSRSSAAATAAGEGEMSRTTWTSPGGVASSGREANVTEDVEHGPVLRQGDGDEAPDAVGDGRRAARCSSSRVASPSPWKASSTTKATSASSSPGSRSYWATAISCPPRSATSARWSGSRCARSAARPRPR